ncbi:MAG TPA: MgtC/SapB family protein [Lichenihabitans sp.]|jgi:putative Mg2+ transporter-C (MgtC) family protein|nr:MgtC/SapB family protein [Lichenihabitans sp.]
MDMPLHPTWPDILLRLLLTVIAGAVIGFNREARGHAAGLRTTILVGLAAAVAMIQANLLLSVGGKAADSFGTLDLMRMPLGILTGVGFIGGGVILKKGSSVTGVTTAATLWIVTAISLCFGGGQLLLGVAATVVGFVVLWAVKRVDLRIPRRHRALLEIRDEGSTPPPELDSLLAPLGYRARFVRQTERDDMSSARSTFEVTWSQPEAEPPRLDILTVVGRRYRVVSFTMQGEADG